MANRLEELVARWCVAPPVTSPGPGMLSVALFEGQSLPVSVRPVSDDEAELEATWMAPAAIASDLGLLESFAAAASIMGTGLMRCEPRAGGVSIRMPLFLEGLSRQEFLNAVAQVARAQWTLETAAPDLEARRTSLDAVQRLLEESDLALDPEEEARLEAEGRASVARATMPAAAPAPEWSPTHVVPQGGIAAWNSPDGSVPAAVRLEGGVEVLVREQRGAWANVVASNGWSGWVDDRLLVPRQ